MSQHFMRRYRSRKPNELQRHPPSFAGAKSILLVQQEIPTDPGLNSKPTRQETNTTIFTECS
jgi:hypothetical protein